MVVMVDAVRDFTTMGQVTKIPPPAKKSQLSSPAKRYRWSIMPESRKICERENLCVRLRIPWTAGTICQSREKELKMFGTPCENCSRKRKTPRRSTMIYADRDNLNLGGICEKEPARVQYGENFRPCGYASFYCMGRRKTWALSWAVYGDNRSMPYGHLQQW